MKERSYTIYTLKPTYSRLLDRVHTVGATEQIYTNSIARITESGEYPKLITSANEDKSFSLDGKHQWHMKGWDRGWIVANEQLQQANLNFTGDDGRTFHQINLLQQSHWNCFECILQMFSTEVAKVKIAPSFDRPISKKTVNSSVEEVAKRVNREIIRGVKLRYVLTTAGGEVSRYHKAGSLMTKFGSMSLVSGQSQIQLDSQNVKEVEFTGKRNDFKSIIYGADGVPLVNIEAA